MPRLKCYQYPKCNTIKENTDGYVQTKILVSTLHKYQKQCCHIELVKHDSAFIPANIFNFRIQTTLLFTHFYKLPLKAKHLLVLVLLTKVVELPYLFSSSFTCLHDKKIPWTFFTDIHFFIAINLHHFEELVTYSLKKLPF